MNSGKKIFVLLQLLAKWYIGKYEKINKNIKRL